MLAASPLRAERVTADYVVQAMGVTVLEVRTVLDTDERGYGIEFTSRLVGLPATLMGEGRQTTRATGTWTAAGVQPVSYVGQGTWRGDPRRTVLSWDGNRPVVRDLLPPNTAEREEVPEAARRGTVDSLSAVAFLIRQVQREQRCEATTTVYDGRRLTQMSARTARWEMLPPVRGEWSGRALRCEFEGRLTAGFRSGDNPAEAGRPQPGTAWLAEVSPGAIIPVRLEIPSRWFGTMSAHLVTARVGTEEARAQPRR
ncbi:DUF3108 domain-containing protein [Roseomonas sp. CCTCC AB2023176]|uniref:DUF3108 domain-containing protein n=1 Tax=Roseomonas sp. CCTCC AB2023176 TaxID=3342640 RepID=UPI0035E16CEB